MSLPDILFFMPFFLMGVGIQVAVVYFTLKGYSEANAQRHKVTQDNIDTIKTILFDEIITRKELEESTRPTTLTYKDIFG